MQESASKLKKENGAAKVVVGVKVETISVEAMAAMARMQEGVVTPTTTPTTTTTTTTTTIQQEAWPESPAPTTLYCVL